MIIDEIAKEIESKFISAKDLTKITFRNGYAVYGSFQIYEDYQQLRVMHKFRFTPSIKAIDIESVSSKIGAKNYFYSIIIHCDEVQKVEFVEA